MRIPLQAAEGRKLFFTAGNNPTQVAYNLTENDVIDAFVTTLLIGEHVLLSASYYFESHATRELVKKFPAIWNSQSADAMFFINAEYNTYTDHGLGKVKKSPKSFSAYSNHRSVKSRGNRLDSLGFVATRDNVDITRMLVSNWVRSCASQDVGSVGRIVSRALGPDEAPTAIAACVQVAESCKYDFVWPAIAAEIEANPGLGRVSRELQRVHADMYAQLMSVTLGAVETTPTCLTFGRPLSERSVGHLGLFLTALNHAGVDIRGLRDERSLLTVLKFEPLILLRDLHSQIVQSAVTAQQNVSDYWRAINLFEDRQPQLTLTDVHVRQALQTAFIATGVDPDARTLDRVLALERSYAGAFLGTFKDHIEAALVGRKPRPPATSAPRLLAELRTLLFTWADPMIPQRGIGGDREYQKVRSALEGLREKSSLDLQAEPAITPDRMPVALTFHNPAYFHFSGHGTTEGSILLEPGPSSGFLAIGGILAALPKFAPNIHCAVFTSCNSITAADFIGKSIHYVILMSEEIDETEAIAFSVGFYLKLAIGMSVREAFESGIGSLQMQGFNSSLPRLYEWGQPVFSAPL